MRKIFFLPLSAFVIFSCNNAGNSETASTQDSTTTTNIVTAIKEETVEIPADSTVLHCFVAYREGGTTGKPIVLILPEWWGVTDYPKSRARQLAELGYVAVAVDLFGRGRTADDPKRAESLTTPFYTNPGLAKSRMEAALAQAKTMAGVDTGKIAAIGYCFGGSMVLNSALMGADLDAVVSFHGALKTVTPTRGGTKAGILVCHGAADKFISPEEIAAFRKGLDSTATPYTFKSYPDAVHAFTNPQATELGKRFNIPISYNAPADSASFADMKTFFAERLR